MHMGGRAGCHGTSHSPQAFRTLSRPRHRLRAGGKQPSVRGTLLRGLPWGHQAMPPPTEAGGGQEKGWGGRETWQLRALWDRIHFLCQTLAQGRRAQVSTQGKGNRMI